MNSRVFIPITAGFLFVFLLALATFGRPSRPLIAGGLTPTIPAFLPVVLKPLPPTATPTLPPATATPTNTAVSATALPLPANTAVPPTSLPATAVPTVAAPPTAEPAPTEAPTEAAAEPPPATNCVNLNIASYEELQQIIHIGPERAQEIINRRPWGSVNQLTIISGIGPSRMADILAQGLACV